MASRPDISNPTSRRNSSADQKDALAPALDSQRPSRPVTKSGSKSASMLPSRNSSRTSSPAPQTSTIATTILPSSNLLSTTRTGLLAPHRSTGQLPSLSSLQRGPQDSARPTTQVDGSRLPRPPSTTNAMDGLHWPVSPRLKSPPPSLTSSRRGSFSSLKQSSGTDSSKQSETDSSEPNSATHTVSVQSIAAASLMQEHGNGLDLSKSPPAQIPAAKLPRGASGMAPKLETVQEGDHSMVLAENEQENTASGANPRKVRSDPPQHRSVQELRSRDSSVQEGSAGERTDDEGKRSDVSTPETNILPGMPSRRRSLSTLAPKVRSHNDTASKHMTVETEVVPTIPQTTTNGNTAERAGLGRELSGTVRAKASMETIRPKKERKKNQRKTPSIISGTASTKADLFEQKINSAVDEDGSESDETFVYESNPPEPRPRRDRHHSRTPSANSMQSFADRRGGVRSVGHLDHRKSMKFSSTYTSSGVEDENGDHENGTIRASNQRKHESDRSGRRNINHIFGDHQDSPYTQAAKAQSITDHNSRHPSKNLTSKPASFHQKRKAGELALHDFDGERADDESTPLIGNFRSPRTRYSRRFHGQHHSEFYDEMQRRNGCFGQLVGCAVMVITALVLVLGVTGLLFATTKPLYGVQVLEIKNYLASEQEIMLDLVVQAMNPNIVSISVIDMDVNIFAKSRHVGTDEYWRHHGADLPMLGPISPKIQRRRRTAINPNIDHDENLNTFDNVDDGTDPIDDDDPENDRQTMLLGRIFHFDSSLTFEGSMFHHAHQNSTGSLRLGKPGNAELNGTARWGRVVEHPYQLLVRGIIKYSAPLSLSSRPMTASIAASIDVRPDTSIEIPKVVAWRH